MEVTRLRVRFFDEAPRIGSGFRIVNVKVGRKMVHLADEYGHKAKIGKTVWAAISRDAIPLTARKRHRRKVT